MTVRRPGNGSRFAVVLVALSAAISTLVVPAIATATDAGAATLPRPKGAGPPVAASGIGTRRRSTTRSAVTTTEG